jgi:hypothetical protein
MSVRVLVEDVFPRALAAAQTLRDASAHIHGDEPIGDAGTAATATRDAYVGVAAAAVKVDRGELTPVQGTAATMGAWSNLGQVRQFLIDSALMEFGVVKTVFFTIVDLIAYAIKSISTAIAEAMRVLFGGTPGDWATRLLVVGVVLGVGWLYVAGFTAGGQSFLVSAGRGQLAVMQGVGRGAAVGYAAAGKGIGAGFSVAAPEAVRLIPSLTGIV